MPDAEIDGAEVSWASPPGVGGDAPAYAPLMFAALMIGVQRAISLFTRAASACWPVLPCPECRRRHREGAQPVARRKSLISAFSSSVTRKWRAVKGQGPGAQKKKPPATRLNEAASSASLGMSSDTVWSAAATQQTGSISSSADMPGCRCAPFRRTGAI